MQGLSQKFDKGVAKYFWVFSQRCDKGVVINICEIQVKGLTKVLLNMSVGGFICHICIYKPLHFTC